MTQFQQDLAASHNNIAVLLSATGDPTGALAAYGRALPIQQKLAEANPSVTRFQEVLAILHYNTGVLLFATGDPAGARASYERRITMFQELADANPKVTELQQYLALTLNDIGLVLAATGDPSGAVASHSRALTIRQKLAVANPKSPDYRNDVASCHSNTADVLRRLGLNAKSREGYEQAIALRERLVQEHPDLTSYRSDLAGSLRRRGLARLGLGDPGGAAADTRRALEFWDGLPTRSGQEWFETACCHAASERVGRARRIRYAGRRWIGRGRQGDGVTVKSGRYGLSRPRRLPRYSPRAVARGTFFGS